MRDKKNLDAFDCFGRKSFFVFFVFFSYDLPFSSRIFLFGGKVNRKSVILKVFFFIYYSGSN